VNQIGPSDEDEEGEQEAATQRAVPRKQKSYRKAALMTMSSTQKAKGKTQQVQ
jgi:hypothetical protein